MKRYAYLRSLALSVAFLGSVWTAHAQAVNADNVISDPYTAAVSAYITAANRELSAFEGEIKAGEKSGQAQRFADARVELKDCRQLLQQLGNADQQNFDALKARYEQSRAELRRRIAAAEQR